ncbi:hypothetical protein [Streptomyces aurantiogriseus]|uniref:Histidine kinase n=1 Tax=Streptomyces aurantiogriseus TaxID=66870 RepID=A0A918KYZ9_9ACTN|nr:hypothetical protein [Streptomyces aurantiogriseus]GGR52202.1 hypothetical protein GCM10010251_81670 [Streptomyces aurantiogriseus]
MDLMRYTDALRQEFLVAAEVGDEAARELAERLVVPLSSAARLVLLDALSAAADEITRELAPGSVEVRLRGLDPTFVVTPPADGAFDDTSADAAPRPAEAPRLSAHVPTGDEGSTARINFRPPEQLKARIEEAAGREGLSVNAWLVRTLSAVLQDDDPDRGVERRASRGGSQFSGWVT